MKINIGISLRHLHISKEDYDKLFEEEMTPEYYINQPNHFSAKQTVTIEKNGKQIEHVRIVGPYRSYTQLEISRTDAYFLKINPPIKGSKDLENAEEITIIGPKGSITKKVCIIAERHIHITKEERIKRGLTKDEYEVKINGQKSGIIGNVKIKETPEAYFELHLDTDDANAFNLKQNDEVEIII